MYWQNVITLLTQKLYYIIVKLLHYWLYYI